MGYQMSEKDYGSLVRKLSEDYRIFAPVLKKGEGRFEATDVVRYDFVTDADEIELEKKSDYPFREFLTPLSETLFYFTEDKVTEAGTGEKPVLIFLRSCDIHALKRIDDIYLKNGSHEDWFYRRRRDLVHLVLIGCTHSYANCFCASMGFGRTDEYAFSIEKREDGLYYFDVKDETFASAFEALSAEKKDVTPSFVTENSKKVTPPDKIPMSVYKDPLWDEYDSRCIACGRCNFVCPTCTCFTMQDIYYTDNGKVGERRRVGASCMVDGYTNVAGGGQYRRKNGERMRFKVLHKIGDFRAKFGYNMCVGCGRCDDVCPAYISYANIVNKVAKAAEAAGKEEK